MSTFTTFDSTVNSFYLAFYGRPADPAGLKFWSQQLVNNNGDLGAITQAFATSEEAQTRFGSDNATARITDIYEQLFNRAPDAAGLAYWTGVVQRGDASLAEVSIAILKGAQGSDDTLASMRQKAADAFTAAVEDGATQYSGYASIEAARVLVRALTADATDTDVALLVKAAVSFADTATKNPKVVEAIATGSTLLNLYDTARGTKDPVALTQALADTAKAAAGDPVTLQSLLRGGGMDQVLKVMPAAATLKDVVDALAKGGLPAAVEVVYPSTPVVTPTPAALKLEFASVQQGELDSNKLDKVTNVEDATVTFKYSGNITGKTFDYSTDGGQHWQTKYLTVDAVNKLVLIDDVFLGQIQHQQRVSVQVAASEPQHVITNFQLRATDANGKTTIGTADLEFDGYAMTPVLTFDTSKSIGALYQGGIITNNTQFSVQAEVGAKVEYKLVPIQFGRGAPDVSGNDGWSTKLAMVEGNQTILVRQTDAAGNRSEEKEYAFVLDTKASILVPTIALAVDSGTPGDGVTNDGTVNIGNLELGGNSGWQYSIDDGEWILGGANNNQGTAMFDLGMLDVTSGVLRVRQVDAAGNVGAVSAGMAFILKNDPTVPEPMPTPTSTTGATSFSLSGSPGSLVLTSSPYAIKATATEGQAGMLDRSQLYLFSVVEGGRNIATDQNYLDGQNFAVMNDGFVRFDAQLTTGLYRLNWTDGAFATTNGNLPQGNVLFAGGIKGYVLNEGFAIDSLITLTGSNDYSGTSGSHAYSYMNFGVSWSIFTGNGHDVIVDDGSDLDIGYRSFNRDAQDLIFKFDAGNDKISLHEKAGMAIDEDNNGIITWASSAQVNVKAVVTAATEAVQIVVGGYISTGTDDRATTTTLKTLNDALDLTGMRHNGDLLILAKNAAGNGGALFHFVDTNGDQIIEEDELNVFAVFDSGAPVQNDIILVGTQLPD